MSFFDRLRGRERPPRCPVTPDDRNWIENSFAWFDEQLGEEMLRRGPLVLPTPEFFPEAYTPDADGAAALLERIRGYMGVHHASIVLDIFTDGGRAYADLGPFRHSGVAGHLLWDANLRRWVIGVAAALLDDPVAVSAALAHELAHVHLFGFGRVDPDEPDIEPLADLLAIYCGLGVIVGNAPYRAGHRGRDAGYEYDADRLGYLPEPLVGYALALSAVARGDETPEWLAHLARGIRKPCEAGLAFLRHDRQDQLRSLLE